MSKKILTALLALVAAVSLCTLSAFAANRASGYVANFIDGNSAILLNTGRVVVAAAAADNGAAVPENGAGTDGALAEGAPNDENALGGDTLGGDTLGGELAGGSLTEGDPAGGDMTDGGAAGLGLAEGEGMNVPTPQEGIEGEEDPTGGGADSFNVNDNQPADNNPHTGLVFAVIPMVAAAALIVVSRKRTN